MENLISKIFETGSQIIDNEFPEINSILSDELCRQQNSLMLVASCSLVNPATLYCMGNIPVNVTAEGYPGYRYHAGCINIDKIEGYAITLAKEIFHAEYANVQAHSASTANEIVMFSLLEPGDTVLGLELKSGGHLTHGANVSYSGKCFTAVKYGLNVNYEIDMDEVEKLALKHKPKLIICGTTAYSRKIDFKRFRAIADRVNAILLADISHIAGLVVAGLHESPVDYAHITTTCTHKQLFGPRGGLILSGKDAYKDILIKGRQTTIAKHLQSAVFPFFQGAPAVNLILGKAMAFKLATKKEFKDTMFEIVKDAKLMADYLMKKGYNVVSNGTDTHLFLIDLSDMGITGKEAEEKLELCNIIVNKNGVPNNKISSIPMGIRIGTNIMAQRKFSEDNVVKVAMLLDYTLKNINKIEKGNNFTEEIKAKVKKICNEHPIEMYE